MLKKILTLGVLYFVQGLPYGFQEKFIPMYLRSAGLSHTRLSLMKLLLLPWLCKASFAPLVDILWTKWLCLLFSLCALAFISLIGTLISSDYFAAISVWLFFLNFFSAFQDVSVDSLAIQILQKCELGHGNTAQIVGYKLGSLFGGGILFWVHYYYGWTILCSSLSFLYFISLLVFFPLYRKHALEEAIISIRKKRDEDKSSIVVSEKIKVAPSIQESHENLLVQRKLTLHGAKEDENVKKTVDSYDFPSKKLKFWEILRLVFKTRRTFHALLFLSLYKLGERGVLSTFPIFLVDQGIDAKTINFWSGLIGQGSSLIGSICAGWLISHGCDLKLFLQKVLIARSVPIFLLWIIVNIWLPNTAGIIQSILFYASALSLCALEFIAGLLTTLVFTLMMFCSLKAPPEVQGTHYSVLSSVEVAGKLLFSSVIGALIDSWGLPSVYSFMFCLSASSVLFIPCIS